MRIRTAKVISIISLEIGTLSLIGSWLIVLGFAGITFPPASEIAKLAAMVLPYGPSWLYLCVAGTILGAIIPFIAFSRVRPRYFLGETLNPIFVWLWRRRTAARPAQKPESPKEKKPKPPMEDWSG